MYWKQRSTKAHYEFFFIPLGLIVVIRFHGVVKGAQNMKFKPYGIEIEPWVTLATLKKMKKDI